MDKKLKRMFILILLVLIIILVVCSSLLNKKEPTIQPGKNSYKDESYESKKEDEISKETYKYEPQIDTTYSEVMLESEKKGIDKAIEIILNEINQRDFDALYKRLDDNSKKHIYPDIEVFKKELSDKTQEYSYVCDGYIADYYGYSCFFYPENMHVNNSKYSFEFIIKLYKDTDEIVLIADNLLDVKENTIYYYYDNFNMIFKKEKLYINETGYELDFVNTSKSNVKIDFYNIYATKIFNGYEYPEYLNYTKTITIKPGETKTIEFKFDAYSYNSLKPTWLSFDMNINGKIQKANIVVEKAKDFTIEGGDW